MSCGVRLPVMGSMATSVRGISAVNTNSDRLSLLHAAGSSLSANPLAAMGGWPLVEYNVIAPSGERRATRCPSCDRAISLGSLTMPSGVIACGAPESISVMYARAAFPGSVPRMSRRRMSLSHAACTTDTVPVLTSLVSPGPSG